MTRRLALMVLLATALAYCTGCGGGAGAAAVTSPSQATTLPLIITTTTTLPGALQGHPYSATLMASNGQGALHWSIAPVAPTTLFVNGLSIDASTGVLSGTANFAGLGWFVAQVSDSASPPRTASTTFALMAYGALTSGPSQTLTLGQYNPAMVLAATTIQGGVPPLSFSVSAGALPRGVRLDPNSGQFSGVPLNLGTYQFTLTATDSYSPPEVATQQFTITMVPHTLAIANSLPARMLLNRSFAGKVIATGGIPPYSFAMGAGTLPPGITFDPATGVTAGTPTTAGAYSFVINASDSSSPPMTATGIFAVLVAPPLGRNDSPATATPISNGTISASISPYIDPPNGVPNAWDTDFYKIVSLGGAIVHVETVAKRNFPNNPLDTVIQITDGNGRQLSSCRQPGDTSTNFTSPCVNDDISATPHVQDSALDFQVPGAATTPTTFYVQVLDWRGDARPDMIYQLQISGVVPPP